jgi:DNA topoisomerase VI subunit B
MHANSGKLLVCLYLTSTVLLGCAAGATSPASNPAVQAKISPAVATAAQELEKGETLSREARTDAQGRLQVYVYVTDISAATLAQLTRAGLTDMNAGVDMGLVQGWVATRDLTGLAGLSCVKSITLPRYAVPR